MGFEECLEVGFGSGVWVGLGCVGVPPAWPGGLTDLPGLHRRTTGTRQRQRHAPPLFFVFNDLGMWPKMCRRRVTAVGTLHLCVGAQNLSAPVLQLCHRALDSSAASMEASHRVRTP